MAYSSVEDFVLRVSIFVIVIFIITNNSRFYLLQIEQSVIYKIHNISFAIFFQTIVSFTPKLFQEQSTWDYFNVKTWLAKSLFSIYFHFFPIGILKSKHTHTHTHSVSEAQANCGNNYIKLEFLHVPLL